LVTEPETRDNNDYNELEGMWKESIVTDLSYYSSIDVCLKELKRQYLSRVVSVSKRTLPELKSDALPLDEACSLDQACFKLNV
jgi:hypothetical protein